MTIKIIYTLNLFIKYYLQMKKTFSTIFIIIFSLSIMISSCQSSAKKIEKANDKVQEAKKDVLDAKYDLNMARQDSITEFEQFKKEVEAKITAHEKHITEFKARIANDKLENRAIYEKKLADLEQKNTDMKKVLAEYKAEGQTNWQLFKTEFQRDVDKLGEAFNDLLKSI